MSWHTVLGEEPTCRGYNARFGILLDMVGGKNATFYKEGYSEKYAKDVNDKVWKKANEMGYGRFLSIKKEVRLQMTTYL